MSIILASFIRSKRKEKKLSVAELAKMVGVSVPYLYKLEQGHIQKVRNDKMNAFAMALNIDVRQLIQADSGAIGNIEINITNPPQKHTTIIPFYRDVVASAGFGAEIISESMSYLQIHNELLAMQGIHKTKGLYGIVAKGDSMYPTIKQGDIVLCDVTVKSFVGDGIYVYRADDLLYIKRLQKTPKDIKIISDNANYKPITAAQVDICAKVIGLMNYKLFG